MENLIYINKNQNLEKEKEEEKDYEFQENLANATIKELNDITSLVREMRRHQREYFKHSNGTTLVWAKIAEKKVDAYIEKYYNPGLFA